MSTTETIAYFNGQAAAAQDEPIDNPYPPRTVERDAWDRGWRNETAKQHDRE
jgi:hypothetical protein